jgi:hypothetical protein
MKEKYIKFPKILHLPWSPGITKDDKVLKSADHFWNKRVIVTVKMDGENTNMYPDYIHARSIDSNNHQSRDWVKNFHAGIKRKIPVGWRFCGENMFAVHSIYYHNLESYFLLYSVWDDDNFCLDWAATEAWANYLGIKRVPVLYDGIWNSSIVDHFYKNEIDGDPCEGYVVRLEERFHYNDFDKSCAKYVRKGHVKKDSKHYLHSKIVKNGLKE